MVENRWRHNTQQHHLAPELENNSGISKVNVKDSIQCLFNIIMGFFSGRAHLGSHPVLLHYITTILSCLDIVTTPTATEHNLKTVVGLDMNVHTIPPTTTQIQH